MLGFRPVYTRPYRVATNSSHHLPAAWNTLNRGFDASPVDRAWVENLTYIWTAEGWVNLAAILDFGSRRIVGWSISERVKDDLMCKPMRAACGRSIRLPGAFCKRPRQSIRQPRVLRTR